ncbi:RNA polymerase sigma factor [Neobacillus notoginsengisoli]|uniref:RNA polymerase sigma factor n=1 Tax=Neobacillus notoginsengisoli TaxID=1578198 RepID=A0A417YQU9_9BACI|nr:RNA polymerase sigma factor [Neobacillus notoginsengisoli]RHW37241.1 RNA polymerase sigma factor [Neobacillus notoginsengisoli]
MAASGINQLFSMYSNDVYHYIGYLIGFDEAEDLEQEVFIRAFYSWESYRGESSRKTWLLSIARHTAADELRKRKRKKIIRNLPLADRQIADLGNTPDILYEINETNKELYMAILRLKESYRQVVILRGIQEMSVQETAEILNWRPEKVNITLHRALHALKKEKERFL